MGHEMKLRGRVIKKRLYAGSKSEHEGLALMTSQGEFKLRRKGGNPFSDKTLEQLEGKEIEGEGMIRSNQFIMDRWEILA